jgi:hypothetical protein
MFNRCNFQVMASAAIMFIASSVPLHAEGGLKGTVGGTLGSLGNTVGNTVGAVGKTVNGVTGNVANTTTKLGALNERGALSADAKSDILSGIMAKARVLSAQELARLCLATGGGEAGCGSGNKPRILGLIDARLDVLSNKRLISVCASVGAGCGGLSSIASVGSNLVVGAIGAEEVPGGSVPGSGVPDGSVPGSSVPDGSVPDGSVPDGSVPNGAKQIVGDMSDREVVTYKKRCVNVLQSPQRYESDIVNLCRLIKRQKV